MKLKVTDESPDEVSVPVEKIFECEDCADTGIVGCLEDDGEGHSYNSTRECHHVNARKMERDADDAWKEKDTI